MGNFGYRPDRLALLDSTATSYGVGSLYTGSAIDIVNFQSIRGVCATTSEDLTVAFEQGAVSGTYDISSTVAVTPGVTSTLDWTTYAQYGRLRITAVNSSGDNAIRLHIYGVPG